eukprot:CAMPEP_0172764078 /NCGR_PEP_ID=MMETSP1074-20121228/176600_1 /TAXON_ID=2916 /ORGANISM="Ceratium fusus, Strain PA161109" /LENGTH=239 /DNA_ID=CAMNT_0013598781 /DNA_START=102 /DNA_END=817 /DNA_ORIENTATION=-
MSARMLGMEALQYFQETFGLKSHVPALATEFRAEDCVVCLEDEPTYKIEPCSHICLCAACQREHGKGMVACPLCRTPITNILQATRQQMKLERKPLHELGHSLAIRIVHNKVVIRLIIKVMVLLLYYIRSFLDIWVLIICFFGIVEMCLLVFYQQWPGLPLIRYALQMSFVYMLVKKPVLGLMFGMQVRAIVHSDEIWTTRFIVRLPHGSKRYSLEEFFREVKKGSVALCFAILVHVVT